MGRTYLRSANTQDVNDIEEKYANFASYTGINESKSFIDVDQNSFEEANNVYVNIDNELSTRPPVNSYTITGLNSDTIYDIFKVNGITFYLCSVSIDTDEYADAPLFIDATTYDSYGDTPYARRYYLDESDSLGEWEDEEPSESCIVRVQCNVSNGSSYIYYGYYIKSTNVVHLAGDNKYNAICWKSGTDSFVSDFCTSDTKVFYIQDWYIFTNGTDITGYKYDYDNSVWKSYTLDELIYVPETTIISGSSVTTDEGALNIFTSAYKETYNLEDSIVTDTSGIDGETVTLTVGDETFTLVWDSDYTSVLSKTLGTISYNVDTIIASKPSDSIPIYVAYCGYWLDVDGNPGFYYSIDGILWAHVTMPEDVVAGSFSATLSEQGWTVWIAKYADEDTTDTATIYYGMLPSSIGSIELTISWYTISVTIDDVVNQTSSGDFTINKVYFESSTVIGETLSEDTGTCTLSTTYKSFALTQNNKVLIKSLEDGSCILHYLLDSYTFDGNVTYTITDDEGNETSTVLESYSDKSMLTALRGSSMYYYGTMLVVINSYNVNAYLGTNILEASYNVFNAEDVELDFTHSTDSYSIVSIYGTNYSYRNNIATHRICYALDNYVPIFGISSQSINSVFYPIYSYLVNKHATVINNSVDSVKFSSFLQNDIYTEQICYSYENNSFLQKTSYEVSVTNGTFKDTTNEYDSDTLPRTLTEYIETYSTSALSLDTTSSSTIVISNSASDNFVMYSDSSIDVAMTDTGWYNNKIYTYFEREDVSNYLPIAIYYSDSNYYYVYWSPDNNTLYTTNYGSATVIRMVTATNDNVFTSYDVNALSISFANELYTTTIATQNLLYQATAAPDGSGKLYFRTDSKVELPDTITGMIYFSQTILAIFVPYTAFEYTASSGDDGIVYYYLYPTKLVLGNRKGYDILQSYDGSTIYICTERGMAGLTYETLVSSTEHIFSYLTDNIFTSYKEFDEQPILFCQYVRWIFMYRQDSNICYIYDMSGSSWWKWTLPYNITKMYADTDNDKLLIIFTATLYYFNFDADDFHDIETIRIDWSFKSQKLHLSAPNNYKHLRWLSVVTTQDTDKMRYKLKFTNYRHWHHMQDSSVVEYEINQLGTMRKKINFVKCNAFQFEISNDKTWKQPEKFVISNIAIKYRITEGIR